MSTSIVILTFNKIEYTKRCIESIRKYTANEEYELIIVDNNSTDETREWLNLQKDLQVIFNDKNVGFPSGCNIGIESSKKGNDILLLNNDTIVTNNWLKNLKRCLCSDESIGAVGPITNSSPYYQQIEVSYKDDKEMESFAIEHNILNEELWEERQKLIGFCLLIKRDAIEKVGLLDKIFSPGNFEDDDYSIRLIEKGYKLVLCKDTFIHHYGGASFSENKKYSQLLERNEKSFFEKWNFTSRESMNIYKEYLQFIEGENPRILEFYCGTGATALYLNQKCKCEYYGYEDNKKALFHTRFVKMNSFYDFKEENNIYESFDYYLISDVTRFLNDEKVKQEALKKIKIETKLIINFKVGENNESNIQEIISLFGTGKYEIINGINQINKINKKLNRTYIVLINTMYNQIIECVKKINDDSNTEGYFQKLIEIVIMDNTLLSSIIKAIMLFSIEITNVLNTLGVLLYNENIINCSEAFKAAYDYDNRDYTTLMNYSEFFCKTGQYDLALEYIGRIEKKDDYYNELYIVINKKREFERKVNFLLRRIEFEVDAENSINEIKNLIKCKRLDENLIKNCIDISSINKTRVLNYIAVKMFECEIFDVVIPLLSSAYEYNSKDFDTNYNLAYVLNAFGEKELALSYLREIKEKNKDIEDLLAIIEGESNE